MKRSLLAATAMLLIGTAAASAIELNCGAPRTALGEEPGDTNPVVKIAVKHDTADHAWRVFHQLRDGTVVSRSEQYAIVDASDERKTQWRGLLNRQRNLYMIGEVRRSDNSEFVYLEWMYDRSKNNLLVMQATARCTARVSLPQPTSQAPTQPFGQTAQAPTQPSYSIQNDERHQPAPEPKVTTPNTPITTGKDSVPIYVSQGGTRVHVDVLLGGQVIRMLLDTGATDLKITDAVASRIVRDNQGTWQQPTKVSLADGSVHTVQVLRVREFRIGGHVVRDVDAFVGDGESMLLAFPVVNSIAPFTIDTRAGELVFHANG